MSKIYDVSLLINEKTIVYPGNPKPKISIYSAIPKNKTNESMICIGSHTGTHIDAMKHIDIQGKGSEELNLDTYYGRCKVFDLTNTKIEIHRRDLEKFEINKGDIILLKTKNSLIGYSKFREDYIHIKLDAAQYLVEKKIKTLGFDYLSVKKFHADDEVHKTLIENLTLYEGLNLFEVPEGEYEFIGFPLRIDSDASPARVVLIDRNSK